MDSENLFPTEHIGEVDDDFPVETAGPKQGRVEDIRTVGRGDDDDVGIGIETVHLDEDGIEGLLSFVVPASHARTPLAAHGVDFIQKDDAGGRFLGLLEEVAHAAGPDPDEHFDEIRTADADERDIGLAGDGLGEEGFPGAGRAHQHHTPWDAPAQAEKFLGELEELDDFGDFGFGFLDACDIVESDTGSIFLVVDHGPGTAEGKQSLALALHLAHEEKPEEKDEEKDGAETPEKKHEGRIAVVRLQPCDRIEDEIVLDGGSSSGDQFANPGEVEIAGPARLDFGVVGTLGIFVKDEESLVGLQAGWILGVEKPAEFQGPGLHGDRVPVFDHLGETDEGERALHVAGTRQGDPHLRPYLVDFRDLKRKGNACRAIHALENSRKLARGVDRELGDFTGMKEIPEFIFPHLTVLALAPGVDQGQEEKEGENEEGLGAGLARRLAGFVLGFLVEVHVLFSRFQPIGNSLP